jgi:hypothetical protein
VDKGTGRSALSVFLVAIHLPEKRELSMGVEIRYCTYEGAFVRVTLLGDEGLEN